MQQNQKFINGSVWVVKTSIPVWDFNSVGYIIKIARMQMGTMLLVVSECKNDKRLINILINGLNAFVFFSDLEIYCDRIR